jgi:phosphate uptake regulator
MGEVATAMVRDSMTAFSQADASLAKGVFHKDREFDALIATCFRDSLHRQKNLIKFEKDDDKEQKVHCSDKP